MAASDEIFLAFEVPLDAAAAQIAEVLDLQGGDLVAGERGYVGRARTVDAPMGIFIGPNELAPEPDVLQAMDAYPVMVDIQFRTHKPIQAEEARLAFETIVAGLPDVPALLLHNAEWLVAAYLPGQPPEYFEPKLTPDAEDVDTWGRWVRRG
ncbi:hypothetical protein [Kribbella sp. NPDC006257]|uniref:hypothetical protein n=1 Tax=Kribbella sp. NPDC006257 TaxID=3156738 RepID=UPI0033B481F2